MMTVFSTFNLFVTSDKFLFEDIYKFVNSVCVPFAFFMFFFFDFFYVSVAGVRPPHQPSGDLETHK